MSLEIITGNLGDACKQALVGTISHADELMKLRRKLFNEGQKDSEVCSKGFYVAGTNIFFVDSKTKTPYWAITRREHSLVLQNIDPAMEQLGQASDPNYRPNSAEARRAILAQSTSVTDLTKIHFQNYKIWSCFEIGTTSAKYNQLNTEERRLAERIFGEGDEFYLNMDMLERAGINATKILLPHLDYIQKQVAKGPFARPSWLWLDSLYILSYFSAARSGHDCECIHAERTELTRNVSVHTYDHPNHPLRTQTPKIKESYPPAAERTSGVYCFENVVKDQPKNSN